jgi:hypothetical protein
MESVVCLAVIVSVVLVPLAYVINAETDDDET